MNNILVITYFNEVMRRPGMSSVDGMFHAASQRMRPMLMTALSACIGLLPAAISTGIGSQVQRPLATVVVGGLLIGPLVLLVVVPPLLVFLGKYDSGEGGKKRFAVKTVSTKTGNGEIEEVKVTEHVSDDEGSS
jgi:cobalt-zinc-cadmium resistance protein CzcA